MQFVNQIAEIVHGVVVEFLGAANKNTGDTFLLVWRSTCDVESNGDANDPLNPAKKATHLNKLADMSVAAFCKILAALQQSSALSSYRGHPRIQFLLGADYRVCLNVGLHAGWAFEGAMGSEYKIDASYISPNIAITANVEQATQHFRVPLLVSEDVMTLCNPGVVEVCRLIDSVRIQGHQEPMELYCVDLDCTVLSVFDEPVEMQWNPRTRYKVRQFLESERLKNWSDDTFERGLCYQTLYQDDGVLAMRERYHEQFVQTFRMGYNNYKEGEWREAYRLLLQACEFLGCPDGPSESLLDFMQHQNCNAPADWQGHRDLEPLLLGPPRDPPRPATFDADYSPRRRKAGRPGTANSRPTSAESVDKGKGLDGFTLTAQDELLLPGALPQETAVLRDLALRKDTSDIPITETIHVNGAELLAPITPENSAPESSQEESV
jgi:class 3 adenylate cyclase